MRNAITLRQAAAGFSPWLPLDYTANWYGVGLYLGFSSDQNGITAKVQFTPNNPSGDDYQVLLSQSGSTTVTVLDSGPDGQGHNLNSNDSVFITGSQIGVDSSVPAAQPRLVMPYQITVVDATHYTFVGPVSQTVSGVKAKARAMRVFDLASMTGITSPNRSTGYLNYPARAVRINNTGYTGGASILDVVQGHGT